MGHANSGKSLNYQVQQVLHSKLSISESRHEAKNNNDVSDKIFSYRTYHNYLETANRFVDYCKSNYNSKTLEDCRQHVNDYIQDKRAQGVSAYTQKSYLSSLSKLYNHSYFKEVETDVRHRADITRSRLDTESSRHFSETRNADLKEFCQATGLRRSELENVKGDCLREKDGQYYVHVTNGKGGKERDALILNNNQNVIDKIRNTEDSEKVWGRVHSKAPIHAYRSDYANQYYNSIARDTSMLSRSEIYYARGDMAGRSFDREALHEVSMSLGHNREDVIVQNYLR